MEKKDVFSKIVTVIGSVLVWCVVLAPVVFGFFSLAAEGVYRFDYMLPAELGLFVFAGGFLLLFAAIRTRLHQKIIVLGLGTAVISVGILFALGDLEQGSLEFAIAKGLLVIYSLAAVVMGIGGALLWRDLFRNKGFKSFTQIF